MEKFNKLVVITHPLYNIPDKWNDKKGRVEINQDIVKFVFNEVKGIVDAVKKEPKTFVLFSPDISKKIPELEKLFSTFPKNRKKIYRVKTLVPNITLPAKQFTKSVDVEFYGEYPTACSPQYMSKAVENLTKKGIKIKSITNLGGKPMNFILTKKGGIEFDYTMSKKEKALEMSMIARQIQETVISNLKKRKLGFLASKIKPMQRPLKYKPIETKEKIKVIRKSREKILIRKSRKK